MNRCAMNIRHASDRVATGRLVRESAERVGFKDRAVEELVLASAELVSNLVKYAGGGEFIVTELDENNQKGLQMETLDRGPGFSNLESAPGDGWSTGGSLGYGLGTVNRSTDTMEIHNRPGAAGGAHVVCQRFCPKPIMPGEMPLSFGAATRPKPGSRINGDDYFIKAWGAEALAGVIDGLGHGQFAHRAANKAVNYLRTHYHQPLSGLFLGVGRECLATRGVVMALARFDCSQNKMSFASLGNIEARVIGGTTPFNFIIRRGIIGLHPANPKVTEHGWDPGMILVLHSDGLRSHWRADEIPGLLDLPPEGMARRLLNTLAKDDDDATVVVVRHDG